MQNRNPIFPALLWKRRKKNTEKLNEKFIILTTATLKLKCGAAVVHSGWIFILFIGKSVHISRDLGKVFYLVGIVYISFQCIEIQKKATESYTPLGI